MTDTIEKAGNAVVPTATTPIEQDETDDIAEFEALLKELEELKAPGTEISHLSIEEYRKGKQP